MKRRRMQTRRRLMAETLEARAMLAADIGFADGIVSINGSEFNDAAEVFLEDGQAVIQLNQLDSEGRLVDQQTERYDANEVSGIFFEGNGGDDVFVNDTGIRTIARGGSGDDVIMGGSGDDVITGGDGDDVLIGGAGRDTLLGGADNNALLDEGAAESESQPSQELDDGSGCDCELEALPPVDAPALEVEEPAVEEVDCQNDASELAAATEPAQDAAETPEENSLDETGDCSTGSDDVAEAASESTEGSGAESVPSETGTGNQDDELPALDTAGDNQQTECEAEAGAVDDTLPWTIPFMATGSEQSRTGDLIQGADRQACAAEVGDGQTSAAASDEALVATDGDDMIFGGLGDDLIFGNDGDDWLFGDDDILSLDVIQDMLLTRLTGGGPVT